MKTIEKNDVGKGSQVSKFLINLIKDTYCVKEMKPENLSVISIMWQDCVKLLVRHQFSSTNNSANPAAQVTANLPLFKKNKFHSYPIVVVFSLHFNQNSSNIEYWKYEKSKRSMINWAISGPNFSSRHCPCQTEMKHLT